MPVGKRLIGRRGADREVVGWGVQQTPLTRRQRFRRATFRYGLLMGMLFVGVALGASDFIVGFSSFWREHQLVTALVTELVLVAAVIFGADAVLKARERRKWRPLGVWAARSIDPLTDIGEMIGAAVHDYCHARYGTYEPEGRDYYDDLLIDALAEPETWEGEEDAEPLLDMVQRAQAEVEGNLERWAPILIAEPELARIAALLPEAIFTTRRLVSGLEYVHEIVLEGRGDEWRKESDSLLASPLALAREARQLDERVSEIAKLAYAYRDDRPIVPIYADEQDVDLPDAADAARGPNGAEDAPSPDRAIDPD